MSSDKKGNEILLTYSDGSGAKSYMRKGFLIYEEMRKYLTLLVIYDFANDSFCISLYMRKILFSFLSASVVVSSYSTGLGQLIIYFLSEHVAGGASGTPSTAASEQLIYYFLSEHVSGRTTGTLSTAASEQLICIIFF